MQLIIGSRASALALRQVDEVTALLRHQWPELMVTLRLIETSGDADLHTPIDALDGDAFTDGIEHALLTQAIDAAVHSWKDLPAEPTQGLVIGAVPIMEDPREALISRHGLPLSQLPAGSTIGTSSERRTATLRRLRPDCEPRTIRGPVDMRLRRVHDGEFDAAVFAVAGLVRLGLERHITEYFSADDFPFAAGQGALAVQCRADDQRVRDLIAAIDDATLHQAVLAESA
jgi:hydroxymethylbilane synthase